MSSIKHHVSGVEYWRSLEQLADGPQVRELLHTEFAGYNPEQIQDGASRRSFLKIMGASLALAGVTLTGCRRWPKERLAPYTSNPRERIPGVPEQFATVWEVGGVALPLLVTSYDGRPIKIEGNPSHPFSWTIPGKIGSADTFAQASILEMYDPHRSRSVIDRSRGMDQYTDWDAFAKAISAHLTQLKDKAASFAILSEATVSPTVLDLKKKLLAAYPGAKWYEYEPLNNDNEREGAKLAFGKPLRTRFNLDKAQTIVLLDADLFGTHPAHTRYAADWSAGRRSADGVDGGGKDQRMNRVYIAESAFTVSGAIADYRIGIDPSRIDVIARNIAANLDIPGVEGGGLNSAESQFVLNALSDLRAVRWNKASVIAAGPTASPHVHALVHAMNEKLGAIGTTVTLVDDPAGNQPGQIAQITELTAAMNDGKIDTLLILGGNPVYDAPNDLNFAEAIKKVPNSVRLGLYFDETSLASKWHLPRAHYLEAWGDSLAWDGTPSVAQPLIEPLYGGKSVIELLALLSGDTVTDGE
ncbi:MAG TPA: TAT-variant-translocated molybdopterin oxidoreductase, partial [Humisphaera sp.]|nr:TAT-variant-translocated molybdopterin oxidoreductase [Humisphaera sp.]